MKDMFAFPPEWRLTIKRIPDQLVRRANEGVNMYLASACSLPWSNAKAVTMFAIIEWFRRMKAAGAYRDVDTFVEGTSGNTGKALLYLTLPDPTLGIKEVILIVKDDVLGPKRHALVIGGATILPPDIGKTAIAKARAMGGGGWKDGKLEASGNVLNLDQYGHPAGWRGHYCFTGPDILAGMRDQFGVKPTRLAAGIGSGGTLGGTAQFLCEAVDGNIATTAVLLARGHEAPGMRTLVDASPPGVTLRWSDMSTKKVEVATKPSYLAALQLARATGTDVGVSTGTTYMGEDEAIEQAFADGSIEQWRSPDDGKVHSVIIGSDTSFAYGDRFDAYLPLGKWREEGKLPLPWEWEWQEEVAR
jgi:cysteine synthase